MEKLIILGRVIGTYDGWDEDVDTIAFYDFHPIDQVSIPKHDCLNVDYTPGLFTQWDSEGNRIWSADIIDTIKHLPKVQDSQP